MFGTHIPSERRQRSIHMKIFFPGIDDLSVLSSLLVLTVRVICYSVRGRRQLDAVYHATFVLFLW